MLKLNNTYLMVILLVLISACKSSESTSQDEVKANDGKPVMVESTTNEVQEIELITFSRGPCYGTCPVFEIAIQKTGVFKYNGKSNVDFIGATSGNLTKADLESIFVAASKIEWSEVPAEYPIDNYDFPQWKISAKGGTFNQEVRGNSNADKSLIDLTKLIDQAIKNANIGSVK